MVKPLKDKKAETVFEALKQMLGTNNMPRAVCSDFGDEFKNAKVKCFLTLIILNIFRTSTVRGPNCSTV